MHPEALTEKGKEIFAKLPAFAEYYLAGGTALALHLGHRRSFDFDLFSSGSIPRELLLKVRRIFGAAVAAPSVNNPDELTVFVEGVKVTFLCYPFPLLTDVAWYEGMRLLSVRELAVTKAYTIGRRGTYKDYVDLYAILAGRHTSLEAIIDLAKQKYLDEFNARLFLEQMIYLDDIEDTDIFFLGMSISKDDIQAFFESCVRDFKL
ncbi:MAG: nucleotidyl transferase AbiEii/AbiGii toxin family protein [Candidatus Sungbacteria bacterium]|uniref:Nucleotidyl transferase AbiEii/AbiGii toxin family protein n=1 Tax=Candidatus Sungiibacteriota bacterium TaxID=2750080 RepID=A0A932R002_9BACT|nr:nucleotidyl transferase AbiEii/AbiGii toxin family protein [Candidatus Sungbacteria bacterium]